MKINVAHTNLMKMMNLFTIPWSIHDWVSASAVFMTNPGGMAPREALGASLEPAGAPRCACGRLIVNFHANANRPVDWLRNDQPQARGADEAIFVQTTGSCECPPARQAWG
ncbi:hypothetical protein ACG04Q_10705 [Roseateles sp. DXS20W]|uniref:Uncharacterized protein n=1 Tax=Pelomonas lactea TaxID=3299030 RepID=A0ABW7GJB1_9BURK